jgi:hypothetical protein
MHALSIHTNRGAAITTHPDKRAAMAALHTYLTRADVYLYPTAERPGQNRYQLIALPVPDEPGPRARARVTGSTTIADLSHPPTPARKRPS